MFAQADRIQQEPPAPTDGTQAVYRYEFKASDGAVCEALETASYGAGDTLVQSTVEASLPSERQAYEFVSEAKSKFGDDVKDASVEGGTARVVIDLSKSQVNRGAYEALLSNNVDSFERVQG